MNRAAAPLEPLDDAAFDIAALYREREAERYALHARYGNEAMVKVLHAIGYDRGFVGGPGLASGALALNGEAVFREGLGPVLPGCVAVPFNDLAALEAALASRDVAAFIVEPIQGHSVAVAEDGYLAGAQALCRKYGALFV